MCRSVRDAKLCARARSDGASLDKGPSSLEMVSPSIRLSIKTAWISAKAPNLAEIVVVFMETPIHVASLSTVVAKTI
jgi:hypothetical protein